MNHFHEALTHALCRSQEALPTLIHRSWSDKLSLYHTIGWPAFGTSIWFVHILITINPKIVSVITKHQSFKSSDNFKDVIRGSSWFLRAALNTTPSWPATGQVAREPAAPLPAGSRRQRLALCGSPAVQHLPSTNMVAVDLCLVITAMHRAPATSQHAARPAAHQLLQLWTLSLAACSPWTLGCPQRTWWSPQRTSMYAYAAALHHGCRLHGYLPVSLMPMHLLPAAASSQTCCPRHGTTPTCCYACMGMPCV